MLDGLGGIDRTADRPPYRHPAPATVVERLGIGPEQPVIIRARRYLLDGHPVETAVSYVPADLADGTAITEVDTGPGGIYARLEETGHVLARFAEEVSARMPSAAERAALELPALRPWCHRSFCLLSLTGYDS